jgi:hypothetical protein
MVSSLTSSRICKALIIYCGLTVNVHRIERVAAMCEPAFPAFYSSLPYCSNFILKVTYTVKIGGAHKSKS